jgi:methyl-accepting chemotaxis protein
MTEVRINKGSAKLSLNRRIDEAQYTLDSLDRPGTIDSYESLLEVRRELNRQSIATRDLVGRLFSGISLLEEYDALGELSANEELSHLDEINQVKDYLARMIDWLRNLVDRVDDMTQSAKTPY